MAKFEYSIRSRDETGAGVKSAQNNLKGLEGGIKSVNKTMATLMGAGAIAGVTMALRKMYQGLAECEKAFAELNPESQKAAGSMAQFQKAVNESKASFGGLINEIVSPARSILIASIQDATDKLKEMNSEADSVGETIGQVGVYTVKVFQTLGRLIYDNFNLFRITVRAIWDVVKSVGEFIWLPLKKGFLLIIQPIKQAFMDMVNWILEAVTKTVNWIGNALSKISPKLGGGLAGFNAGQITMQDLDPGAVQLKSINKLFDEIGDTFGEVGDELKKIAEEYVDIWKRKPEDARLYGITGKPGTAAGYDPSTEFPLHGAPGMAGPGEIMGQQLGTAQSGTGTTMPPWLVPIVEAFDSLVGFLGPLGSQFASLSMILNPLQTIMQAFYQAIAPVVNELLAPLVGILQIIGQTMAAILMPALRILSPVIEFLGKAFVFLYNMAIVPFGNALIAVFNILKALGQTIYYIVTFQWGKLGSVRWDPTAGALERIEYDTLGSAGAAAINEQSSESATYSTGRDITVNVIVNTEVITGENGGLRELALIIQREISNAVALGVA